MSSKEESTATRVSQITNKLIKQQQFNRRPEKWEINLVGDFLLHLYHRQILIKEKYEFELIQKFQVKDEFEKNFANFELREKLKSSCTDYIQSLLERTGFLINTPKDCPFYKLKSSAIIRYRKNKLDQLDNARINGLKVGKVDLTQQSLGGRDLINDNDEVDDQSPVYSLKYRGSILQQIDKEFCLTNTGCYVCQINFESMGDFEEHMNKHSDETDFEFLNTKFKKTEPIFSLSYRLCKNSHKFCFTMTAAHEPMIIDKIIIVQSRNMIFVNNAVLPCTIQPTGSDTFYLDSHLFTAYEEHPIILVGRHLDKDGDRLIEQHHLLHTGPMPAVKFSYNPTHLSKQVLFKTKVKLPDYFPPRNIVSALKNDFFQEALMNASKEFTNYLRNDRKLNPNTYVSSLKMLLQIEDTDTISEYEKLSQQNIQLTSFGDEFSFKVESKKVFLENIVSPFDNVYLQEDAKSKKLCGMITNVHFNRVGFQSESGIVPMYDNNRKIKYKVEFRPSRFPIRYQYRSLDVLSTSMATLSKFLFPSKIQPRPPAKLSLELYNEHIYTNPEQLEAVCNIVSGPRNDAPYIIFGPPGTGKTTTVVEAILQLLKKSPRTKILVTASSNAACDEVAIRLCRTLESLNIKRAIVRIFARSSEKRIDELDDLLLEYSNLYDAHFLPSVDILHEHRIVVCTLTMVAKLATGGFGKVFSHVFIDEVAACTETEALLGMVGILNPNTSLIISGDHKQLGPILKSTRAEELGLSMSLMDRLLDRECYRVDPDTGYYDRSIQTRLRLNFRSHPEIVNLFSRLFYNHSLEARSDSADHNLVSKWHMVPKNNFPIIFHSVRGRCQRHLQSVSLFNTMELNVVMDYLRDLIYFGINGEAIKESDIGVISPYKKQYQSIKEELHLRHWFDIEVGSVETFQGREKRIIIVSFVRSDTPTLGFLTNPRRLNVTISRPKSLLILIGNAATLSKDSLFADIIEMCRKNKTLRGDDVPKIAAKSYLKAMEDLNINDEKRNFNARRRRRGNRNENNIKSNNNEGQKQRNAQENGNVVKSATVAGESDRRNNRRRHYYKPYYAKKKSASVNNEGKKESKEGINVEELFDLLPSVPNTIKASNSSSRNANEAGINSSFNNVKNEKKNVPAEQPTSSNNKQQNVVNADSVAVRTGPSVNASTMNGGNTRTAAHMSSSSRNDFQWVSNNPSTRNAQDINHTRMSPNYSWSNERNRFAHSQNFASTNSYRRTAARPSQSNDSPCVIA